MYHSVDEGCKLPKSTVHVSDAGLVCLFIGVIPLQLRDVFRRPPRPETKTVLLASSYHLMCWA